MRWTPDTPLNFSDSKFKYVTAVDEEDSTRENGDHDDHEDEGVCVYLCAYKRHEPELIQ